MSDLALVNVTVTDPLNRLVTGLEKENFRVFEDGVEQEVVTLSSEDVPVSIGLIFDMSGSMSDKVDKARQAAVEFMRTANPLDQFFLVSFNDRAELTSGFTSSVEELQNRMMFTASRGRTALLDAVYLGLSQMRGAHNGKRALLIISDGGDNHSRYNENDVKNFLKEADCQLYAIGIYDPIGIRSRTSEELNGPSLLSEMTEMTGGRVFPVENISELPDIAAKIGMELRNQYVLGYKPSNAQHNGAWRKIKVKLRRPKGSLPSMSTPRPATTPPTSSRGRLALILLTFFLAAFAAVPCYGCVRAATAGARFRLPRSRVAPNAPAAGRLAGRLQDSDRRSAWSFCTRPCSMTAACSCRACKRKISACSRTRSSRSFPSSSRRTCRSASAWWWTTAAACGTSGPQVNAAALTFVKTSNPQDEGFVVNFNDDYYLDTEHDFTSDLDEMKTALERIDARGSTALYDAVIGSLDHLKKGTRDKKVILVVTDGEDNASRTAWKMQSSRPSGTMP